MLSSVCWDGLFSGWWCVSIMNELFVVGVLVFVCIMCRGVFSLLLMVVVSMVLLIVLIVVFVRWVVFCFYVLLVLVELFSCDSRLVILVGMFGSLMLLGVDFLMMLYVYSRFSVLKIVFWFIFIVLVSLGWLCWLFRVVSSLGSSVVVDVLWNSWWV